MVTGNDILDKKAFDNFQELMGPNLRIVLLQHMEVAQKYLNTINEALEKSDFEAMCDAAHPLNSSSRQIGAFQVADIAEGIENLSKSSAPNIKILEDLIFKLQSAQTMFDKYIRATY